MHEWMDPHPPLSNKDCREQPVMKELLAAIIPVWCYSLVDLKVQ